MYLPNIQYGCTCVCTSITGELHLHGSDTGPTTTQYFHCTEAKCPHFDATTIGPGPQPHISQAPPASSLLDLMALVISYHISLKSTYHIKNSSRCCRKASRRGHDGGSSTQLRDLQPGLQLFSCWQVPPPCSHASSLSFQVIWPILPSC